MQYLDRNKNIGYIIREEVEYGCVQIELVIFLGQIIADIAWNKKRLYCVMDTRWSEVNITVDTYI